MSRQPLIHLLGSPAKSLVPLFWRFVVALQIMIRMAKVTIERHVLENNRNSTMFSYFED